jgi:hypothetical protein
MFAEIEIFNMPELEMSIKTDIIGDQSVIDPANNLISMSNAVSTRNMGTVRYEIFDPFVDSSYFVGASVSVTEGSTSQQKYTIYHQIKTAVELAGLLISLFSLPHAFANEVAEWIFYSIGLAIEGSSFFIDYGEVQAKVTPFTYDLTDIDNIYGRKSFTSTRYVVNLDQKPKYAGKIYWEEYDPDTAWRNEKFGRVVFYHLFGDIINNNPWKIHSWDSTTTSHPWGQWITVTLPTCTTTGSQRRTCTLNSAHTETQSIAALGHSWGPWMTVTAATCTRPGSQKRTCTRNSLHTDTQIIPINSTAHNWGAWTNVKAATCTTAGSQTKTCTRNSGHTETQSIAALGHIWPSSYSTSTYQHWKVCNRSNCSSENGRGIDTPTKHWTKEIS